MSAPGEMRLLRYVPGDTAVHRLWAGTKLLCLSMLSLALTLKPSWAAEAVTATLVLSAFGVSRVPRSAFPRFPRWLVFFLLAPGALSILAGGPPVIDIGGTPLAVGGFVGWARFFVLAVLLALGAALIGWTTPLGDIAPAIATLGTPFRLVRLPVNEIAVAVGLSIRSFPLLGEEVRILQAARKVRQPKAPEGWRAKLRDLHDLLVSAMVSSVRRAREMAEAIESRGGMGRVPRGRTHFGLADGVALGLCGAGSALMLLL